ncbi:MAG: hypothetical protein EXQ91_06230 [Alphaproteobacteria bacterium]|nr:hypothetical protein [Alphaproteobacteria bacterium]
MKRAVPLHRAAVRDLAATKPHIVFRSLSDAVTALDAARRAGVRIVLRSAPGAIRFGGPLYLRKIVAAAATGRRRRALAGAVIDCGGEAALAFAAIRAGWRAVLFRGPGALEREVEAAAAHGHAGYYRRLPPPLDAPPAVLHAVKRRALLSSNH